MTDLAARVERLEAIDELRRLKFNYTWHLDRKEWVDFKNCFTEDFVFKGTGRELPREEFFATVQASLGNLTTIHELHQYQFDFEGPDRARGLWRLHDHLLSSENKSEFRGRAVYEETYVRTKSGWRIASTTLRYQNTEGSVGFTNPDGGSAIALVLSPPA
ncbi:hypothetical protein NM208_g7688 [Fusarium decemcellulare]|uniref:Uncharacterized protein n=1 Tax=Fusarium decemcellulare TaxID=57161 RepID=A0ACC1S885_9HYPO|nr:hypothetical protein NM208_g7688 [Fusarium decemcellulare]